MEVSWFDSAEELLWQCDESSRKITNYIRCKKS
jgi:hypothetical protein